MQHVGRFLSAFMKMLGKICVNDEAGQKDKSLAQRPVGSVHAETGKKWVYIQNRVTSNMFIQDLSNIWILLDP